MPFRRVPQQSDRGSIKDLANGDDEQLPPTEEELRLKSLYEHGLATRDQALIDSLGLFAINGAPKDPIAIFRHREYIDSLKARLAQEIQERQDEVALLFPRVNAQPPPELHYIRARQENARQSIQPADWVKTAGVGTAMRKAIPANSFRRVK